MALSGFFAIDGTLGANLNRTHTSADRQFALGTSVILNDNRVALYVVASVTLSTSAACHINTSFTVSTSAGGFIALGSFNPGDHGWIRTSAPHAV